MTGCVDMRGGPELEEAQSAEPGLHKVQEFVEVQEYDGMMLVQPCKSGATLEFDGGSGVRPPRRAVSCAPI